MQDAVQNKADCASDVRARVIPPMYVTKLSRAQCMRDAYAEYHEMYVCVHVQARVPLNVFHAPRSHFPMWRTLEKSVT